MKKACLSILCVILLAGCQGLQRGIYEGQFVSSARPAISVAVQNMSLLDSGRTSIMLDGTTMLGGLPVSMWLAVYGEEGGISPQAIVSFASVPGGWYWDADGSPFFSIDQGTQAISGQAYSTCTYLARSGEDAFIPVIENAEPTTWIVRRFSRRYNEDSEKITLEYREMLTGEKALVSDISLLGYEYIFAFEKRASTVFSLGSFPVGARTNERSYLNGVTIRYLGKNFLGTASAIDWRHE